MWNRSSWALAVAVLAAALAGCADFDEATQAQAQQQQQRDLAAAHESCARFAGDAPAFAGCVETQLAVISYQRRRALDVQAAPGRVPPYGRGGQLCLPSAAGAATTC
jgi:uncharacterized membrane protein